MKTKLVARHGDIPLYSADKLEGEIIKHDGSFVLAEGEATGHHHRIRVKNPSKMEIRQNANGFYMVKLDEEATLSHEEHATITIQPGIYVTGREQEMDWFSLTTRKVID